VSLIIQTIAKILRQNISNKYAIISSDNWVNIYSKNYRGLHPQCRMVVLCNCDSIKLTDYARETDGRHSTFNTSDPEMIEKFTLSIKSRLCNE
jgi:hypothetical protein